MSEDIAQNVGTSTGPFNLVGNPNVNRRAIYNQVTGVRRYASDIMPADVGVSTASGFVYMGYVQCPYPHAMIKKIDVSKAEAAGYVTLSALDTDYLPSNDYYSTSGNRTRGPLPYPEVLFAGQQVVAVGAKTPDLVNDAINLVEVEYEPLPYVFDVEEALAPGAPQLWPGGNSPGGGAILEGVEQPSTAMVAYGDVEAAFADPDAVVVTLPTLDTQFISHFDMEGRGLIAEWRQGNVYIWCNTQYAAAMVTTIANYFMIPPTTVTVRTGLGGNDSSKGNPVVGNGLGNKTSGEEYVIATALSRKAGAPVAFFHSRKSHALATSARFPERAYIKIAGKNGLITAVKAVVYANVGALAGAESDLGNYYAIYNIPNIDLTSYSANTNAFDQAAPMRDVGESQCHFQIETAVDMLAEKMGIDPATFRLNNMRTAGYTDAVTGTVYPDTAFDASTGYPYSGYGQPDAHLKAVRAFNWSGRWKGWRVPSGTPVNSGETVGTGQKLRGVGVSCTSGAKGALSPPETGQISVSPSGVITMYSGGMDHGAGGDTALPIIAGELLGQTDFSNMLVVMSDTSLTTDTGGTYGSRMTRNGGMGLVMAAKDLATQWFPLVAAKLGPGTQASNLAFGNNTIYDVTNPSNSMSFKAAAALLPETITGRGAFTPPPKTAYRVGGTKICEVEVDTETADVRVIDYVGALGLGRVIFSKGADGQNQGGFIGLGIGESLFEEIINDSSSGLRYSGSFLNPNYLDFKVPTIMQAPGRALSLWSEYVDKYGPFGAVGIGENTLMSVIPCILNALSNALGGYRFTKTPVRKEDIVAALQWMKDNGKLPVSGTGGA